MRKLMVLAAMLAMTLVAASPALAQATVIDNGDDTTVVNSFNTVGFGFDSGFDSDFESNDFDSNDFDSNDSDSDFNNSFGNGFDSSFSFGDDFPFDNGFSFDSGFDSSFDSGDANAVAVDGSVAIATVEQSFNFSD